MLNSSDYLLSVWLGHGLLRAALLGGPQPRFLTLVMGVKLTHSLAREWERRQPDGARWLRPGTRDLRSAVQGCQLFCRLVVFNALLVECGKHAADWFELPWLAHDGWRRRSFEEAGIDFVEVVLPLALLLLSNAELLFALIKTLRLICSVKREEAVRRVFLECLASPSALDVDPNLLWRLKSEPPPTSLAHEVCALCLETFDEKKMVTRLPNCRHMFHATCAIMSASRSNRCPLCRASLTDAAAPVALAL